MEGGTLTIAAMPVFQPGKAGWENEFPWAQPVTTSEFWSALQTLAWASTRSKAFTEALGAYDRARDQEMSAFAFGILQHIVSSRHCQCGLSLDREGKKGWEFCLCIRDAGKLLLGKIRLGEIVAYDAQSRQEMGFAAFVNIDMDPRGRAWIDLQPAAWFGSAAVISAFPDEGAEGQQNVVTGSFASLPPDNILAPRLKAREVEELNDRGTIAGLPHGWIDGKVAVIRFCRLLEERLNTSDLAPWMEAPNVDQHCRLWGGSEQEAVHSIRLNEHAVAVLHRAFLTGKLSASLFDGRAFKALPKAAFIHLCPARNAMQFGVMEFDPLWPDEWWLWNSKNWAVPKAEFESWMASDEPTRTEGLPAETGETCDDMVTAFKVREPRDRKRIPLSEAISWAAFGLALEAQRFEMALHWDRLADGDLSEVQRKVTQVLADIMAAGADGRVSFFGRHVESRHEKGATNVAIDLLQLDDYRASVIGRDDLLYGEGLHRIYRTKNDSHWQPSERRDLFTQVTVSRADLMAIFPPPQQPLETVDRVVPMAGDEIMEWCREWLAGGHGNTKPWNGEGKAWDAFKVLLRSQGLSRDDVFRPAFREVKTKSKQ